MKIRGRDAWGSGRFGASRGGRIHNGVDIEAEPGSIVESLNGGTVTKIGYPYGDDLSYRYVEITDSVGARWRYFYVDPCVSVAVSVEAYEKIGVAQALGHKYPGITEHIHLEIIKADGSFVDPTGIISKA